MRISARTGALMVRELPDDIIVNIRQGYTRDAQPDRKVPGGRRQEVYTER